MKCKCIAMCLMVLCCGAPRRSSWKTPGVAAPNDEGQPLLVDTSYETPSGAKYTVSKGWRRSVRADIVLLEGPEKDVRIVLAEFKAKTSAEAVRNAWRSWRPGFVENPARSVSLPAKDGWNEVHQFFYDNADPRKTVYEALALKKDDVWYIALSEGSVAALSRRSAELESIRASFRAVGVEEESFAQKTPHVLDTARLTLLMQFIEEARLATDTPGASVAVLQGNGVIAEKGFGVLSLGSKIPVTPTTKFMIGSTTKSLTTLMTAKLVDAGKLSWDTKLQQVLSAFELGDTQLAKTVTVANAFCACTGFPRQDMQFIFDGEVMTPESTIADLRHLMPTTAMGETFQYSNAMVSAGGYAAARASGETGSFGAAYDAAMAKYVFAPLEMSDTTFDVARVAASEHAMPHARDIIAQPRMLSLTTDTSIVMAVRPAGAAWSTAHDMGKYLTLESRLGINERGDRVVSTANLLRRRQPQIKVVDQLHYGLGLFTGKEYGVSVVHHGGNTLGFTSDMAVYPDLKVGIVLLANAGHVGIFRNTVRRRLLELLFDGREEAASDLRAWKQRTESARKELLKQIEIQPDSAWLASLIGAYHDDLLGDLTVRMQGGSAIFDTGGWSSVIGRKTEKDGSVKVVLTMPPLAGLELIADKPGTLKLVEQQHTYVFERKSP